MMMAMAYDAAKVTDTVIGIERMNCPIIPVASRSGMNAQMVVSVVVVSNTL